MAKFDPKAKAKRQKIIAGVLGVGLVGVLIFQAPTIMSMFGGGSSATASEPASTTPAPAVPAPATPGTPAVPTPAGATSQLVDSDPAPEPDDGQLVSFDRFESKDPFAPQVSDGPTSSGAAPEVPVDTTDKTDSPHELLGDVGEGQPGSDAASSEATISVNGAPQEVRVGGTFPASDPIFKLVSLKGNTAKVGIVGGTYATGSQTVTLKKGGKPVTLMNTADGTTYVLRLVSVA